MALQPGIGYDGSVDEAAWKTYEGVGLAYNFGPSPSSMRPTAGGAGDRSVTIASGMALARGVYVPNVGNVVMNHAASSSGDRWDMVVLRRDYSTNTSTFVIIQGGATKVLPTRTTTSTVDDQPVYMARISQGSAVVAQLVDLRVHQSNSGAYAYDTLALTYLDQVGSQIRIGSTIWDCVVVSGSAAWLPSRPSTSPLTVVPSNTSLTGPPPNPSSTSYQIQAGSNVVISDGGANTRLTFPTPFPNGLLAVFIQNGDSTAVNAGIFEVIGGTLGTGNREWVIYRIWGPTSGGNTFVPLANVQHRANWLAIGW